MSDTPVRSLMLETSDPFARRLLEAGRVDGPEPGARDRALLGLGLAPVGLLALAPAPAAASVPPAGVVLAHGKALPWLLGKSLGVGLLGSVMALTALDLALPRAEPAPGASALAAASSAAAPTSNRAGAAAPSLPGSAVVASPLAPIETKSSVPSRNAEKEPNPARPSLSASAAAPSMTRYAEAKEMIEALARVRRALPHEAAHALALLDDFAQRYPASPVAEEAVVLRIEALHALGRASEAQALASRFLRDAPASIYRARVRALM